MGSIEYAKEENRAPYALEVLDIYKSFSNNNVLKGITFGIRKGEILGLVGSNGAGKSTLMKIVNGIYKADKGTIKINSNIGQYKDAQGARNSGIAMVYQEFSLIPTMTVAQNLFLGVEPKNGIFIDDTSCIEQAKKAFRDFNVEIDPQAYVESLSIGDQQIVEIIKALLQKPAVLILDEPTASLTQKEIAMLFSFINRLKQQGMAIILISHHLQEVKDICDKVVVLRDGKVVLEGLVNNIELPDIIHAMIGRKFDKNEYIPPKSKISRLKPVLEVKGLRWREKVQNVSFEVYQGEILGIAGLLGSGRTEILKNIVGLYEPDTGEILIDGSSFKLGQPWDAIRNGIFLVPENRRKSGIIAGQPIRHNMLLPIWKKLKNNFLINDQKGKEIAGDMIKKLSIKTTGMDQYVERLSGGNQQKVVFAKSLVTKPKVLLLDDPTVGVDIEAKNEIANLVRNIADQGNGVLLVSSEMEELARLADRVLILKQGIVIDELSRDNGDEITEQTLSIAIQS
ncbi:MAG: sugar ABC transporter ATP-binding protein [Clostridia bacterium]